jgi:hypothetical protein
LRLSGQRALPPDEPKNLIGTRLKQTGARWKVANIPKLGALCCLTYSDGWLNYWDQAA